MELPEGAPEAAITTTPDTPPSGGATMRLVAIGATAVALLGISIPFVWQTPAQTTPPLRQLARALKPRHVWPTPSLRTSTSR